MWSAPTFYGIDSRRGFNGSISLGERKMPSYKKRGGKKKLSDPKKLSAKGLQEEIEYRQKQIDDLQVREREASEKVKKAARNRATIQAAQQKIAILSSRIKAYKSNPINYSLPSLGRVNMLLGTFKQEKRIEIEQLERQISEEASLIDSLKYSVDAYSLDLQSSVEFHRKRISLCIKEQEIRKQKETQARTKIEREQFKRMKAKEKLDNLRAQAAISIEQRREMAYALKKKLVVTKECPYCGEEIGTIWHADHIYPVSRGGQSTLKNMVIVCPSCNAKKSGLTLLLFIEKCNLNRDEIVRRLKSLDKEF